MATVYHGTTDQNTDNQTNEAVVQFDSTKLPLADTTSGGRPPEGYSKVVKFQDPNAAADAAGKAAQIDPGDSRYRSLRVNLAAALVGLGPDGTLANVPAEFFDGLFTQDRIMRALMEQNNQLMRRQIKLLEILITGTIPDGELYLQEEDDFLLEESPVGFER